MAGGSFRRGPCVRRQRARTRLQQCLRCLLLAESQSCRKVCSSREALPRRTLPSTGLRALGAARKAPEAETWQHREPVDLTTRPRPPQSGADQDRRAPGATCRGLEQVEALFGSKAKGCCRAGAGGHQRPPENRSLSGAASARICQKDFVWCRCRTHFDSETEGNAQAQAQASASCAEAEGHAQETCRVRIQAVGQTEGKAEAETGTEGSGSGRERLRRIDPVADPIAGARAGGASSISWSARAGGAPSKRIVKAKATVGA